MHGRVPQHATIRQRTSVSIPTFFITFSEVRGGSSQKCELFTQKNVCAFRGNHFSPFFVFCACVKNVLRDSSARFQSSDLLSSFSFSLPASSNKTKVKQHFQERAKVHLLALVKKLSLGSFALLCVRAGESSPG